MHDLSSSSDSSCSASWRCHSNSASSSVKGWYPWLSCSSNPGSSQCCTGDHCPWPSYAGTPARRTSQIPATLPILHNSFQSVHTHWKDCCMIYLWGLQRLQTSARFTNPAKREQTAPNDPQNPTCSKVTAGRKLGGSVHLDIMYQDWSSDQETLHPSVYFDNSRSHNFPDTDEDHILCRLFVVEPAGQSAQCYTREALTIM